MIQHLNRISGVPKTMKFETEDAEFLENETQGGRLILQPIKDPYRSKSQTKLHLNNIIDINADLEVQQKLIREKIHATSNYEKLNPTEKARLHQEAMILPKVKSHLHSNPKFLKKSHIMGINKYTGGTFRYTPLEAQKIDRSKSQLLNIKIQKVEQESKVEMPKIQGASQTQLFDAKYYAATRDVSSERNSPARQAESQKKKLGVSTLDELVRLQ